MKRIIVSLFAAIAAVMPVMAQSMPALLIPTDARSLAMGGAVVALESEADLDADALFGMWAPATADNIIAGLDARYKVSDKFALEIQGSMFKDKPYEVSNSEGKITGTFAPSDMLFGLGGCLGVSDAISVELKAKMFMSTLGADLKGNAFGADLIVRYHADGLNVAAGAANLGTPIKFGNKSYPMPMMAKAGASYSVSGITASAEVDYLFSGALMAGLGAEYCYDDMVFLRAGFHYGDAAKALPTFASVGAGFKFSGIRLNVAYITANPNIGNSVMLSLGYTL